MRNKEVVEASRRKLWPDWTVERMQEEAIKKLKIFWRETTTSFSVSNDHDNTVDFPMTAKAFLFRCFDQTMKAPMSNTAVNKKLFKFYATYSKPHYDI